MINQRPDIVIYCTNVVNVEKCWLVLDAKYRTSKSNLADAFKSAFTYNQTLFDPDYGGRPLGSYLLVPKVLQETRQWFSTDFIGKYPYGAFEYRPAQENSQFLVAISKWLKVSSIATG